MATFIAHVQKFHVWELFTHGHFKDHFQIPIEKKADGDMKKRLYFLIKPYLLRREKRQVAADLPEKMESITYCGMTEEQERLYDKTKSFYRDVLLKQIKDEGLQKSRFSVLQGLTKLRQLANHPLLCEVGYVGESGKMEAVLEKLETVLEQHHKVLIFSQFVQHLQIIKRSLDEQGVAYAYLGGSTTDRKGQVVPANRHQSRRSRQGVARFPRRRDAILPLRASKLDL